MVGGGVPKNFTQDTVVCAEILGHDDVEVHKYAVQITVADVRDGACSSSTLQEAASWGKVQHRARADGVRRSDHRRAADRQRRLSPRRLEEARSAELGEAVQVSESAQRRNTKAAPKGAAFLFAGCLVRFFIVHDASNGSERRTLRHASCEADELRS